MKTDYKIGDVVKVNITGKLMSCIILSEAYPDHFLDGDMKFLISVGGFQGNLLSRPQQYKVAVLGGQKFRIGSGHYTLIGDQKVYVEYREFYE